MTIRHRGLAVMFGVAAVMAAAAPARATMPPRFGALPAPVAAATRAGMAALGARLPSGALGASALQTQSVWRVPVILCSFTDSVLTYGATDFNQTNFDTTGSTLTGSIYDYYQWASGGRLRVIPTVVATLALPRSLGYYSYGSWGLSRLA